MGWLCQGKHRFAFCVATAERTLDLIAPSEELYRLWVEGLQCLLLYGTLLVDPPVEETA
jgi:hypothetical protein